MKRKWDTVWADPGEATEGMFEKDFIGQNGLYSEIQPRTQSLGKQLLGCQAWRGLQA